MTTETVLDLRPIRAGLRDLATRMPNQSDHVHALGRLLAAYMNDEMFPEGITLTTVLLMNDIARGESGYSAADAQIPAKLTGLPSVVQITLRFMIPKMLRAAAGEEHRDVAEQLVTALKGA